MAVNEIRAQGGLPVLDPPAGEIVVGSHHENHVGPLHEGPCFGPTAGAFHVDAAEPLASVPDTLVLDAVVDASGCRALDAHDRRPMVSEEHAGHRRRHSGTQLADPDRQLHDAQIREHCGLVPHGASFRVAPG